MSYSNAIWSSGYAGNGVGQHLLRAAFAACLLVMVAACGQSLYRVNSSFYGYDARENLTVEEIKPAVQSAAIRLGWELSDVQVGGFTGKREWGGGKHKIVIAVTYNPKNFNINYKDSEAMGYNGGSIHHSYNDFVTELEKEIQGIVAKL